VRLRGGVESVPRRLVADCRTEYMVTYWETGNIQTDLIKPELILKSIRTTVAYVIDENITDDFNYSIGTHFFSDPQRPD